ncbi:MAG: hypothetical protein MHM6MM_008098 [Cercozoa sp. M6MM]
MQNPNPELGVRRTQRELQDLSEDAELSMLRDEIFDQIRTIRDPEHDFSLEELSVVSEEGIELTRRTGRPNAMDCTVYYVPTVPHCSLALLIGLCIRQKLCRNVLPHFSIKLQILIEEGTHQDAAAVNKQVGDKERCAAAMENPQLRRMVEKLTREPEE